MSYRIGERKPPKKHRNVTKLNTLSKFYITNGSIASFAFPCFYKEVHPPKRVNEHGHNSPTCRHYDVCNNICTIRPYHPFHYDMCNDCRHLIDLSTLIPIHFLREYGSDHTVTPSVILEKSGSSTKLAGLECTSATIDPDPDDYIIRTVWKAECPSALDEPQECKFSVVITTKKGTSTIRKDVAMIGKIIVMPAEI